jgi:hypothetical protein
MRLKFVQKISCEGQNWIESALERGTWHSFVTLTKLWFPLQETLIRQVTTTCSRRLRAEQRKAKGKVKFVPVLI